MEEEVELNFRLDANGRTAPPSSQQYIKDPQCSSLTDTEVTKDDCMTGNDDNNNEDDKGDTFEADILDYTSKTVLTRLLQPKEPLWHDLLLDCEVGSIDLVGMCIN